MKTRIVCYRQDYAEKAIDSIWFRHKLRWLMRRYGFMYCCLTGDRWKVDCLLTTLPKEKDVDFTCDTKHLNKQGRKWKRYLLQDIQLHMQDSVIAHLERKSA